MMLLTVKHQINHISNEDYLNLRYLCRISKNLMNQAIYLCRQHFFKTKELLDYNLVYKLLKSSRNYTLLNSNMAQQSLRRVDQMFKSFQALNKLVEKGLYDEDKVKLPKYYDKDGFAPLFICQFSIKNGILKIPISKSFNPKIQIKVPPILVDKKVKFIQIIPKYNAKFFEILYSYEIEESGSQKELDQNKALAIDLGINNLLTCATSDGESFIVDGKRLKSFNQWYNKRNSFLQSVKDKQGIKHLTRKQIALVRKRNNRVNDYISKACKKVIKFCLSRKIGILVVGHNKDFQRNSNLGKKNNQEFTSIPFRRIINKLEYLSKLNGIKFLEQEESYTSKASFLDNDEIPKYGQGKKIKFSGKRVKRGLYRSGKGILINADVNGALNILRKSKVVSLEGLYRRGDLSTPLRIRIC